MRNILAALLVAWGLMLSSTPVEAATIPTGRTPASYFGMHNNAIAYGAATDARVGSFRLWDSGTTWRDVEVSPGVYDWTRMDTAVNAARAAGASVLLTMGGTPRFYASQPDSPTPYGAGFNSETSDLAAWTRYVRAVVTRYKGKIGAYEPLNEIDIGMFYAGTEQHAMQMSRILFQEVNRIDPGALVTTPSFVDRYAYSQYRLLNYLKAGGARYADVISYHPYGMPENGPEKNAWIISELVRKTKKAGVYRPIWSTEVNYGLPIGGNGVVSGSWSVDKQSAFVTRTYLMQRAAGARRVYWYNWSSAPFLGVKMADVESGAALAPARAFDTVRWWMRGALKGCTLGKWGGYTCTIRYGKRLHGIVRWHPTEFPKVAVPEGTTGIYSMYGNRLSFNAKRGFRIGAAPVLFRVEGRR